MSHSTIPISRETREAIKADAARNGWKLQRMADAMALAWAQLEPLQKLQLVQRASCPHDPAHTAGAA